ncbi:MAG: glycosyltransferase family 2 protein [Acidobacteriota bacterium]|nr:glycosyltransferase family 2 protein [Acidobacteriota bacterium]
MFEETLVRTDLETPDKNLVIPIPSLKEKIDPILIFFIVIISSFILIISIKFHIFHLWADFLRSTWILRLSTYPLLISAAVVISGVIFRTILWFRYKAMTVTPQEKVKWPFVSVIMPALNEEELIESAIESIFTCRYPKERLEVICINDGSKDSTLYNMLKAKQKYGSRLEVINFPKNLGKRKALYTGLKKSKGDIIITVDTDSRIDRNAIKNLVIPLIKDKNTGAVSGRVEVLNDKENFLTRMLAIRYSISFNFGRAYQSVYGSVFCCPGALTAYRKHILKKFIHEWMNQKFCNVPCTYGEDRALTTQILKAGYMTRFQSNAVVYTKVPSSFSKMSRMYIRWTRSYIRESILFAKFMFTNYRSKHRVFPVMDFFFLNLLHPFHIFSFGLVSYSFLVFPGFILRHMAFLIIAGFLLSLYYLRSNKSIVFLYGIPYALITAFCLWWIVPYAALTMKNQSWMTR